jgi:S-adenosylmethionine:tRNA ribosyltransferase-isomerase
LKTSEFDYHLPPELIATQPRQRRDASRLMRLDRASGAIGHHVFRDLASLLPPRALIVVNDTRVIPARLRGRRSSGGAVELLVTRKVDGGGAAAGGASSGWEVWEALAKNTGGAGGSRLTFEGGITGEVLERREEGRVVVRFDGLGAGGLLASLDAVGEIPLPPYIEAARKRRAEIGAPGAGGAAADDRDRYQTVYAAAPGAVAAPTAGLHFTPELLDDLARAGHQVAPLTLHVGPGTFRPVKADDPRAHVMDEERFEIPRATADAVNAARADGRAVVAVGTTVVRALEAAVRDGAGVVRTGAGATRLYLLPGDELRVVTDLVTNFHLPRSTLLMLVAAFAGREAVLAAYAAAVAAGYRFYSYGDAMLISGRRAP